MKATIDRAGRVVIPKAIRERARLEPGTELDIRLENDVVEIFRTRPKGRLIEEGGHLFWKPALGSHLTSTEDINQAVQDVRSEREEEILRGAIDHEDRSGF